MKFEDGKKVVCVNSCSNAYKLHTQYTPFMFEGKLHLKGDDGLVDPCDQLISGFAPVAEIKGPWSK